MQPLRPIIRKELQNAFISQAVFPARTLTLKPKEGATRVVAFHQAERLPAPSGTKETFEGFGGKPIFFNRPSHLAPMLAVPELFHRDRIGSRGIALIQPKGSTVKITIPGPPVRASVDAENIRCSINMKDAPIDEVLRELSKQTNFDLLLLNSATTKVTLRLTDTRLRDVIRHLCALSGLKNLKVGSTWVIAKSEDLKAGYPDEYSVAFPETQPVSGPGVTFAGGMMVVDVHYVDPAQLQVILTDMYKGKGLTVSVVPGQTRPSVSAADTARGTGVTSGVLDKEANATKGRSLVLRGEQEVVNAAINVIHQIDVPSQQISIAVTIHDISNDALKELGLTWSFSDVNVSESDPKGLNFGSVGRTPLSFSGAIKALEKTDKAKLLASPNISLLDQERAFILVGNRLSFPVITGYSQANTPIFDKQEERVGIYLQVAATIGGDGNVTLSLYPQVSTITGYLNVNGGSYPQIATREAQTTLRVKSGQTIVMGGMLRDEELQTTQQVPILSKIPILGEIFTHRKRTKSSSQVIISITPVILKSQ